MRKFTIFIFLLFFALKAHADCGFLNFETAWQRIVSSSPSLAAADAQVCIQEAEKRQVSLRPNPVVTVEGDNLGVRHPNEDTDPPQTTFSLSQTIELGGKRRARRAFASCLTTLASCDVQIARQEMRYALLETFIEVSFAQEKLRVAQKCLSVAQHAYQTVSVQVENGKVSPLQLRKASITVKSSEVALREAFSKLEKKKKRLAGLWGSSCPDFEAVVFDLYEICALPCLCDILGGIQQTPDYIRASLAICCAQKNLRLQKANRIPDVTIMGGYRVFNDSDQNAWVVGAAMPLPVFDRNQGNIQRACCEISQAEYEREELEREFRDRINVAFERMQATSEEAQMMSSGILSEAMQTYELIASGFEQGKFDFIEVLDSQSLLCEVESKYLDVIYKYHMNQAELARLNGDL